MQTLKGFSTRGKPIYVVTHYVHPLELTDASTKAVHKLLDIGIPVLNQAPVLRGVNDDQETFNASQAAGKKISLADLIVLGGS
ncbi:MAG: hypothetical protein ABSA30_00980, partial [Candidatus Aminicenantales bacterium]